jgi:hypothetical protein
LRSSRRSPPPVVAEHGFGDDDGGEMDRTTKGGPMADNSVAYVAVYDDVNSALADLDVLGEMHDDELIGKYDAAVIDQEEGKPHLVKRVDRPRINVLPELVGAGALPRGELRDAAKELDPGEAALLVVGEPTLAKGFDKAVTRANKVAKESFDASADELADVLMKAAKAKS